MAVFLLFVPMPGCFTDVYLEASVSILDRYSVLAFS
jgi:hypothetical protein